MQRTLWTKLYTTVAWAVVLALAVPWTAFADVLVTDGDGIAPIATHNLDFGTVCAATTTTKPVLLGISRNGNSMNVFANGATVTIAVGAVSGAGLSATGSGSVTLPATWSSQPNNTIAGQVSSSVKLVAGPAGSFAGSVTYTASGTASGGGSLTRTTALNVLATATNCDNDPPVLSLPGNLTVEATSAPGTTVTYTATATDANPAQPSVTCTPTSGGTFPISATTVSCSATDAAGNTATGSFSVTVRDTTAPLIYGTPTDKIVEAAGPTGAIVSYTPPTATDTVDGTDTVSCTPSSGGTFALGSTSVSCSATDAHGNAASTSFGVTVRDTTPPSVGTPSTITAEAGSPSGVLVSFTTPTATDAVGPANPTVSCDHSSGSIFPLGSTSVACSATDTAGNAGHSTFSINIQDTTAPVLSLPAPAAAEATAPSGAVVTYTATANDAVDGLVTPSCAPASGSTFAIATTPVGCSATDAHANTSQGSFNVTVHDTTAPAIAGLPGDIVVEATGPTGATASWATPTANDVVDGTVSVGCTPVSGSTFTLGSTTVTCSATDAHSNTASSSFTVTVRDTTPPTISGTPANQIIEATGPTGAVVTYTAPTADDVVDGTVTASCTPVSGSTFTLGSTTVTCSATDAHSNTASSSFTVTVADTTAPSLTLPADQKIEATGSSGATASWSASASDSVDGSVNVSCDKSSGATFPLGKSTVSCSATDAHGNAAQGSFTIEVVDTTRPALTMPANMTVEATGASGAPASWPAPTASDLVDGPVPVSCTTASGSTFALGTTTVTCSATDAHANTANGSFTVTVQDTTAPKLTLSADIVTTATSSGGAVVTYAATGSDSVDGPVSVSCDKPSGSTFPLGATTVNCSATDAHGNTGKGTFKITVSYSWSNFLQPINVDGSSRFKLGSTIPVKFQLTGISAGVGDAIARLYVKKWDNNPDPGVDEAISTAAATTGNLFRYDATSQQYIFNLSTKAGYTNADGTAASFAAGTWTLSVVLGDGGTRSINIQLVK
jgi:hypothetical protein